MGFILRFILQLSFTTGIVCKLDLEVTSNSGINNTLDVLDVVIELILLSPITITYILLNTNILIYVYSTGTVPVVCCSKDGSVIPIDESFTETFELVLI
jgi:hypothetical protein